MSLVNNTQGVLRRVSRQVSREIESLETKFETLIQPE